MPRKLALSPTQGAILKLLEEAGEENLAAVLNTLEIEPDQGGKLPPAFLGEVEALVQLGLVAWLPATGGIPASVRFDSPARTWRSVTQADNAKFPRLVLTSEGKRALVL